MTATGRDFLLLSNISGSDSDCILAFDWNEDFSEAKIDGYWEPMIKNNEIFLKGVNAFLDLVIEKQTYWRWKFNGVDMEQGKLK